MGSNIVSDVWPGIETIFRPGTEILLARNPRIIGLGVYIWNAAQTVEVVASLKRLRPEIVIILGGPEVSYEIKLSQ